jgi:hypothetical protein
MVSRRWFAPFGAASAIISTRRSDRYMTNAERTAPRWPQITLRELLYLMTFFAVLYGFDMMRGDRESLMANVVRTPILLAVFLLWRILQHCRGVRHVLVRVFIDATMGAAIGTMATVLGIFLLSYSFSNISVPLLLGACSGAIAGVIVAFASGRYRRKHPTNEAP